MNASKTTTNNRHTVLESPSTKIYTKARPTKGPTYTLNILKMHDLCVQCLPSNPYSFISQGSLISHLLLTFMITIQAGPGRCDVVPLLCSCLQTRGGRTCMFWTAMFVRWTFKHKQQIMWNMIKDLLFFQFKMWQKWPASLWRSSWQIYQKISTSPPRKMLKPLKSATSKMELTYRDLLS